MKQDFLSQVSQSMARVGRIFIQLQTATGLYIALVLSMLVMGVRSTQFITRLVNVLVWDLGGVQLSLLGLAIAVALILFVASGSYFAGILPAGSREQRLAIELRNISVFADGLFNMVETIYTVISHNTTAQVLSFFDPGAELSPEWFMYNLIRLVVILGILGIGLIPTLLAFRSSQLLGALQGSSALQMQPQKRPQVMIIPLTTKQRDHLQTTLKLMGEHFRNPFSLDTMAKACQIPKGELLTALDQAVVSGFAKMLADGRYEFAEEIKQVLL